MNHLPRFILITASLVLLASCGRTPVPSTATDNTTPLLGIADLGSSLSSQALVSGLTITLEDEQISDQDGIRTRTSQYLISGADIDALSLYPVDTSVTFASTNISNIRTADGTRLAEASVAQSIVLDADAATADSLAEVQGLLEDTQAQTLGTVVSSEAVSGGFRVVLEKRYPYNPEDPNAISSFLMLFAFIAADVPVQPTAITLTFSMAAVNIVPGEQDIEVVITPNLPAPTITLAN